MNSECHCPPPRGLTRRSLLRTAAAAGALGVLTTAVGETVTTRYAFAADGTAYTGDVLVVLSLRGGFDGLGAVVPAGDPDYLRLRPTIGLPTGSLLPLTGIFGLHPALAPLLPLWKAGSLAFVHAVRLDEPGRRPRRPDARAHHGLDRLLHPLGRWGRDRAAPLDHGAVPAPERRTHGRPGG